MPSLWRGLFTVQQTNSSSKTTSSSSKSRTRTQSSTLSKSSGDRHKSSSRAAPAPPVLSYVPTRERSSSFAAPRPVDPLYQSVLYNAASAHAHEDSHSRQPRRPPLTRSSTSRGHSESSRGRNTSQSSHTPSVTFSSSSRSRSNSSVQIGGFSYMHAKTPSSSSLHRHDITPRPILKQNHTWHGDLPDENSRKPRSERSHSHRSSPSPQSFRPHPLLNYNGSHHTPLLYDILYTPSPRSVLNATTRKPIDTSTLDQPATEPANHSQMILKSHKFPWSITVHPRPSKESKSESKFYFGSSSPSTPTGVITSLDVMHAVHACLSTRVTQTEWDALGSGSKEQKSASRAYERRCEKMGGGWEGGVRRVDWLGKKTRLVGIEPDEDAPHDGIMWKLIFAKA